MHAKAVEIAWHDNAPIWSVDISRTNRVVTASGDKVARVWRFHNDPHSILSTHAAAITKPPTAEPTQPPVQPPASETTPSKPSTSKQLSKLTKLSAIRSDAALVEWLCDLRAHATTINVARFSPDGLAIATAADLGEIVIWRLDDRPVESSSLAAAQDDEQPKERWQRETTLRGHVQDVLDLAWSADASRLVSASVDNAVMVWDVRNPARTPVSLRHHANFVQGVSIDPFGRLIASMGNDRALRVFTASGSTWCQVASISSLGADTRLFVDDSKFKNFFRRLAWSPDGSVLACPSGIHLAKETKRMFAVHIFMRNQWKHPLVHCGGLPTPPCAVRFSPVLYQNRGEKCVQVGDASTPTATPKATPFEGFTYRMVFAVACVHTILFYDTEHMTRPFACVEGLHCAEHTDITWSADGRTLLVSSMDGYISAISFSKEELGNPLTEEQTPAWLHKHEDIITSTPKKDCKATVTTIVRPRPVNNIPSIPAVPIPLDYGQKLLNPVKAVQLPQKRPLGPSTVPSEALPSQSSPKRSNLSLQTGPPSTTKTTSAHGYRIQPPTPQTNALENSHTQTATLKKPTTTEWTAIIVDNPQANTVNYSKDDDITFVSETKAAMSDAKPSVLETPALQNAQPLALVTPTPGDGTPVVKSSEAPTPKQVEQSIPADEKTVVKLLSASPPGKATLLTPADKPSVMKSSSASPLSKKAKQPPPVDEPSAAKLSSASAPKKANQSTPVSGTSVVKHTPSASPPAKMVKQPTAAHEPLVVQSTSVSPSKNVKQSTPVDETCAVKSSSASPPKQAMQSTPADETVVETQILSKSPTSENAKQSTAAEGMSVVKHTSSAPPPSKKAKQSTAAEEVTVVTNTSIALPPHKKTKQSTPADGTSMMKSSSPSPSSKKTKQNPNGTPKRRNKVQKVQTKFFLAKPNGSGVATAKIRADVEKAANLEKSLADQKGVSTVGDTNNSDMVWQNGTKPDGLEEAVPPIAVERGMRPVIVAQTNEGSGKAVDLTVSNRQQTDLS